MRYKKKKIFIVTGYICLFLWASSSAPSQNCDEFFVAETIEQLKDKQAYSTAKDSLEKCQVFSKEVLGVLVRNINNDNEATRLVVIELLTKTSMNAEIVIPSLIEVSQEDESPKVRKAAISSLNINIQTLQKQLHSIPAWNIWEIQNLKDLQIQLDSATENLEKQQFAWPNKDSDIGELNRTINQFESDLRSKMQQPQYRLVMLSSKPWIILLASYIVAYTVVFLIRPLWILEIARMQSSIVESSPKGLGEPINILLSLVLPAKYHPRILDAWVNKNFKVVRDNFIQQAEQHAIHIPRPIYINENLESEPFEPKNLEHLISKDFPLRLVIWGEGGSGKTSLACQLAHWAMWDVGDMEIGDKKIMKHLWGHRMLPVLIESELDETTLTDAVESYLKETIRYPIDSQLLKHLLEKRRILVIGDHLSEMDEFTRKQYRPFGNKDFLIKALIVTSRDKQFFSKQITNVSYIRPSLIGDEEELGEFLKSYLSEKVNREKIHVSFNSNDYMNAKRQLLTMFSVQEAVGTENKYQEGITILLATLYANLMISQKQLNQSGKSLGKNQLLPQNIPDLMLRYLDSLNLNIPENEKGYMKQETLYDVCQNLAWACLKQKYTPGYIGRKEAIEAIKGSGEVVREDEKNLSLNLSYLEEKLRLIKYTDDRRSLRFKLDPLAEYLAALNRFYTYKDARQEWIFFLSEIKEKANDLREARGFLLALFDCCREKGNDKTLKVPDEVIKELIELTNLNEEVLHKYELKRRAHLLLPQLDDRDPSYRIKKIRELIEIQYKDQIIIDKLHQILEDKDEDLKTKIESMKALKALDEPFPTYFLIQYINEGNDIKYENILNLLGGCPEQEVIKYCRQVFEDENTPLNYKTEIQKYLRRVRESVPLLVPEFRNKNIELLSFSPPEEFEISIFEATSLVLVKIPAGKFMMGSLIGEGRESEYPKHEVNVSEFWIGRDPITQAMWHAVASLPKIKQDLIPCPSKFKGQDLPVENISWEETIEFCARLSALTRWYHFRLPSEAEWEYACRAGRNTPFHFGNYIDQKLSNYGSSKSGTTQVGAFGVTNQFGLYDMHGNIWEWCLDHWHENYKGAPCDGSPWSENDGSTVRRMLRGGSWCDPPEQCRCSYRQSGNFQDHFNNVGFRVVCA